MVQHQDVKLGFLNMVLDFPDGGGRDNSETNAAEDLALQGKHRIILMGAQKDCGLRLRGGTHEPLALPLLVFIIMPPGQITGPTFSAASGRRSKNCGACFGRACARRLKMLILHLRVIWNLSRTFLPAPAWAVPA